MVKRKNKSYKKRELVIYSNNKIVDRVIPFSGWYAHSCKPENLNDIRLCIMQNLYWLIGHDCDFDDWYRTIEQWNTGKHVYGVNINVLSSMFFNDEEMTVALNSFYNN